MSHATNTLIVGCKGTDLEDDAFFNSLTATVNELIKTESVEFIKLPSLQRVLIVFSTHQASTASYGRLRSMKYHVQYSAVDTRIPESTFLQLPDPGKKYVISPPPSPPANWVDKPEEGPNLRVIHNPQELSDLLFKRLGARIEKYTDEDYGTPVPEPPGDAQGGPRGEVRVTARPNVASGTENVLVTGEHGLRHEDFVNGQGQLEVPKSLADKLNGNPIIVLDPPAAAGDGRHTDGRNEDGISVNRIKTARPPSPP